MFILETRKKLDVKIPGENRYLFVGGTVLGLLLLSIYGLVFYKNSLENKMIQVETDLGNMESQRNKQAEQNLLTLNKQIVLISSLLDNHILWSRAFAKVESLLQNQVQFKNFSAEVADNKFKFQALANNYTVIARQIAAFISDDSIKDISLDDVKVLTTGKLEFSMKIEFDKDKFLK